MRSPKLSKRRRANGAFTYFANLGGKQVGLGTDFQKAKKRFGELLETAKPKDGSPNPLVRDLIAAFLTWCERNCAEATHHWYRRYLVAAGDRVSFSEFVSSGLRVADLKSNLVTDWLGENYESDSANYRNAARAVKRVVKWAHDQELIAYLPLAKVKLPKQKCRELAIDTETWQKLLALLENKHGKNYDDFSDYLTVIWETGCRPQEARIVEAKFFDRENRRWVFPVAKSKGKERKRVVYLSDTAFAISERLALKNPTGPMFLQRGKPWDKNSIRCKFRRLKEKLGLPELCAYTLRHSWATRMLEAEVDSLVVAELMGHSSTKMLELHYSHIRQRPRLLLGALQRVTA